MVSFSSLLCLCTLPLSGNYILPPLNYLYILCPFCWMWCYSCFSQVCFAYLKTIIAGILILKSIIWLEVTWLWGERWEWVGWSLVLPGDSHISRKPGKLTCNLPCSKVIIEENPTAFCTSYLDLVYRQFPEQSGESTRGTHSSLMGRTLSFPHIGICMFLQECGWPGRPPFMLLWILFCVTLLFSNTFQYHLALRKPYFGCIW